MVNIEQLYQYYQQHPHVFTDTRKARKGGIFFAIGQKDKRGKGIHRGNNFAIEAIERLGAAYAVVNDPTLEQHPKYAAHFLLVEDCEHTLQQLAQHHRQQLGIPVIAIAGSNGKTTTKELLHRVLEKNYRVFSTQGNLNNHLGVPLSMLQIDSSVELALLELGANHLGETAFLAQLTMPDYGIITNCGKDHLGEYGSVENVIKANGELFDYLALNTGHAFVNGDDPIILRLSTKVKNRSFYGREQEVSAQITKRPLIELELSIGEVVSRVQTQLFGAFWLDTLIGVAHIAHHFGVAPITIKNGIEAYSPASLRSQQISWQGHSVLLDCYNANPSSMDVFIVAVQESASTSKILILGEMLELGKYSQKEHLRLLNQIDYQAFEQVIVIGKVFQAIERPNQSQLIYLEDTIALKNYLERHKSWNKETAFFVKGSRENKLETIFL